MSKGLRFAITLTAAMVAVALVLFAIGQLLGEVAQRDLIKSKADQIATLRVQRDTANARADRATTRADAIVHDALAGIQQLTCDQHSTQTFAAAFARLVYTSPTATAAQRALVAPFIAVPSPPKGCPTKPAAAKP